MTNHLPKPNDVLDELQQRWLDGDRVAVETLVAEHPQVTPDASVMLDLIYAEVLLREDHGQKALESEYGSIKVSGSIKVKEHKGVRHLCFVFWAWGQKGDAAH